jgi:hypothetical protein
VGGIMFWGWRRLGLSVIMMVTVILAPVRRQVRTFGCNVAVRVEGVVSRNEDAQRRRDVKRQQ